MANGLFDIGPLFDREEEAQLSKPKGLFGFGPNDLSFGQGAEPLLETRDLEQDLRGIREATEKRIQEVRDQGLLARYPTIQSPEDEKKERERLKRRGLEPDEIDRRIEKFKRKGGRVKTSAKLQAAAAILSEGIKGYLAAAGRGVANTPGIRDLVAQSQQQIEQQVQQIQEAGEEQKALLLQRDQREFQQLLAEIKADSGLQTKLGDEARKLGINPVGRSIEDLTRAVVDEQAARAKQDQEQAQTTAQLARERENRLQVQRTDRVVKNRVETAVKAGNVRNLDDEDIAHHFGLETQEEIDASRATLEAASRVENLRKQEGLLRAELDRNLKQQDLDKKEETPEEQAAREQQAAVARQEARTKAAATAEYQEFIGLSPTALQTVEDDPEAINAFLDTLVSLLLQAQPELTRAEAGEQVKADIAEASANALRLDPDQLRAILGQQ